MISPEVLPTLHKVSKTLATSKEMTPTLSGMLPILAIYWEALVILLEVSPTPVEVLLTNTKTRPIYRNLPATSPGVSPTHHYVS